MRGPGWEATARCLLIDRRVCYATALHVAARTKTDHRPGIARSASPSGVGSREVPGAVHGGPHPFQHGRRPGCRGASRSRDVRGLREAEGRRRRRRLVPGALSGSDGPARLRIPEAIEAQRPRPRRRATAPPQDPPLGSGGGRQPLRRAALRDGGCAPPFAVQSPRLGLVDRAGASTRRMVTRAFRGSTRAAASAKPSATSARTSTSERAGPMRMAPTSWPRMPPLRHTIASSLRASAP
jgi:hypothetical protein